ncbi:thermonuclease family protein, partial [Xanthomonas perforans]
MKLLKLLKCWVLSVLVLVALPVSAAELVGRATVTDGDTITVAHQRIRLWGIDAPESAQQCSAHDGSAWPCGRRAAAALDGYLLDKTVHCQPKDTDRYGRRVAECFVQGQSVNAWMVRSGWAVAYRQYATAFEVDERLA